MTIDEFKKEHKRVSDTRRAADEKYSSEAAEMDRMVRKWPPFARSASRRRKPKTPAPRAASRLPAFNPSAIYAQRASAGDREDEIIAPSTPSSRPRASRAPSLHELAYGGGAPATAGELIATSARGGR